MLANAGANASRDTSHVEPRRACEDASAILPTEILRQRGWGDDRVGAMIARSATGPAMSTQAGWAAELSTVAVAFLRSLQPMSAGAQLLSECLSLTFGRAAQIRLPS